MQSKKAFTLVELVVVVMILGILAAVAAPKLLGTSKDASENAVRQSLAIVRDAIERYAAENGGAIPAAGSTDEADLKTALAGYLQGPFPNCQVGKKNSTVNMVPGDGVTALTTTASAGAWNYDNVTGEFIINDGTTSTTDSALSYEEF